MEIDAYTEHPETGDVIEVLRRKPAGRDFERIRVPLSAAAAEFAAQALSGAAGRQVLGLDVGGLIPPDLLPVSDGENFVVVPTTSDPIQNGLNLLSAITQANGKTPNGMANSGTVAGNRVDVLVPSGRYDLNGAGFTLNLGVNLVGLSGSNEQVFIYTSNSTYGFVMCALAGYNTLSDLTLKITSSTASTSAADNQAALIRGTGFYGNYVIDRCVLQGLNLFSVTSTNSFTIRDSAFQQIRFTSVAGWTFDNCTTYPCGPSTTVAGRPFSILGSAVSNTTQFYRCYVTLSDLPAGGAPKWIDCPYVKFTLESGTVASYVAGTLVNCAYVSFSASVATAQRFLLSIDARNCYFYGVTHWKYQAQCRFYHCSFNASVTMAQLAKPDAQAGMYIYFYHCLISAADVASDYLLQLATGTSYLYMAHCSLYYGATLPAAWTLRQGTLAAGFNEVTPSMFGSLSPTAAP